jgi:hypothetical protein
MSENSAERSDGVRKPDTSRADVKGQRVEELIPETDETFGRSPGPQKWEIRSGSS